MWRNWRDARRLRTRDRGGVGIRSVHSEATADISDVGRDAGGVGRNQIATEALKGADSVEAIGKRLKAGTNCGACRPEIAKLLHAGVCDAQPA